MVVAQFIRATQETGAIEFGEGKRMTPARMHNISVARACLAVSVVLVAACNSSEHQPQKLPAPQQSRTVYLVHELLDPDSPHVGMRLSVYGYLGVSESGADRIVRLMPYESIDSYELGTAIDWITLQIDIRAEEIPDRCLGDFVVVHGTLGNINARPALGMLNLGEGIVSYSNGEVDFCYASAGLIEPTK